MAFLESYVVPVCLGSYDEQGVTLRKLVGTAFFIGNQGYYLTARHVIERAVSEAASNNTHVGLVIKRSQGSSIECDFAKLGLFNWAPKPYDIAVGWVNNAPKSPLKLQFVQATIWQRIAALGYPESATSNELDALWLNLRGYRGYVQRQTTPRDIRSGNHPNGYELSFLTGPGSSGAPVFTVPDEVLIGVAVASYRTEFVEEEFTEVDRGGAKYHEKRVRVEQFGFAHSLENLHHWRPTVLGGKSLEEAAKFSPLTC